MFLYNIKIAFRNLIRQKSLVIINIFGLSIGIACTIILFLMVRFINSTDRFHDNYANIFVLQQDINFNSGEYTADRTGGATGPTMAETYPQIQHYTRLGQLGEMLLMYFPQGKQGGANSISFVEQNGAAVDSTFFDVFSFEFVQGGPPEGIYQKKFIYLTESISKKFFKNADPIGETIFFQEGLELTVIGILRDLQDNSSIQFSYLVPFQVMEMTGKTIDGYAGDMFYTYFVLDESGSADIINREVNEFLLSQYEETLEVNRYLSHIQEVYLHGEANAFIAIIVFGVIGLGILLIACINYVNLSTARSIDRAKEVGIRKTGGADRLQLVKQFLAENLLITLVSVNFAILIIELILPTFNNFYDVQLTIPYHLLSFWIFILALVVLVGTLSGFYPAFMLSSFEPTLILKNFEGSRSGGSRLRKVLVVSQFSITIFFIICTIFLYKQASHVLKADLGINKEHVIYIPTRGKLWEKFDAIKSDLLNESYVEYVTSTSELPNFVTHGEIDWGKERENQNVIARIMWCSEDMLETFGIELAEGRFYDKKRQSDIDDGIIVNEEIIKILNYEEDPIGQRFRYWNQEKTIIGVVKNFTFFPINIGAKAIIIPYRNINANICIKTTDGFDQTSLARLEAIIKRHNPDYPFEHYSLADVKYPFLNFSKTLIPSLLYFSVLGIFISCLGMFGLALFTAEKRTKEIGIRKVFGATISGITIQLSKSYLKLVLIANLVALPLAYFSMRGILGFFVEKVNLSPLIFIGAGLLVLLVALLTVFWQSISAARKNPIESLRYE